MPAIQRCSPFRILWIASKLGGTTPTRRLERARLDAGESSLEGVDGVGVDHRLTSLLVRDYLASVESARKPWSCRPGGASDLPERDQPSTPGRHLLRLAHRLHILSPNSV